jgi:hypothetical protein
MICAILPAYIVLLSSDRTTDGGFARWLDLTLSTHLGKSLSSEPGDAGFGLVIGEWKQFKQVNTSTTPVEQTECRESKVLQRVNASKSFFDELTSIDTFRQIRTMFLLEGSEEIVFSFIFPPLISGIAIGAP